MGRSCHDSRNKTLEHGYDLHYIFIFVARVRSLYLSDTKSLSKVLVIVLNTATCPQ